MDQFFLFPQCFLPVQNVSFQFHHILKCRLQTISIWYSWKLFGIWYRVKRKNDWSHYSCNEKPYFQVKKSFPETQLHRGEPFHQQVQMQKFNGREISRNCHYYFFSLRIVRIIVRSTNLPYMAFSDWSESNASADNIQKHSRLLVFFCNDA